MILNLLLMFLLSNWDAQVITIQSALGLLYGRLIMATIKITIILVNIDITIIKHLLIDLGNIMLDL